MSSPPLKVKCPTCKREVLWGSTNSYRPFCCERCKLIDLGEWAAEEKVIPGDTVPSDFESNDESFYH